MTKTKPLFWTIHPYVGNRMTLSDGCTALYAKSSNEEWDGDDAGNEWTVGFSIHFADEAIGPAVYTLYFDDGKGNGKWISSHETLKAAMQAAELADAKLPLS